MAPISIPICLVMLAKPRPIASRVERSSSAQSSASAGSSSFERLLKPAQRIEQGEVVHVGHEASSRYEVRRRSAPFSGALRELRAGILGADVSPSTGRKMSRARLGTLDRST